MINDYFMLSLIELRKHARRIGVKSPTSLTKLELINKINDIETGKTKPYFSKRGRPTKNIKFPNETSLWNEAQKNHKLQEVEKLIEDFKKKLLNIINK